MTLVGISIYVVLILTVAYFAGRKETRSEFMIGGRKFGTASMSFSMAAAYMGAGMLTWTTSVAYSDGLGYLAIYLGVVVGFVPFYLGAGRIKRLADEHGFYTMTDLIHHFCGYRTGILIGIVTVFCYTSLAVLQMVVGGKLLETLFDIQYSYGVILMAVITTVYLFMGGFKAVVRTDIMQYLIVLLMAWFILGNAEVRTTVFEVEWLSANIAMVPASITALYLIILNVTWADIWQRIYAADSVKTVRKSIVGTVVLMVVLAFVIGTLGMATKVAFPDIAASDAFVYAFGELLPSWLGPLSLVLLLSIIMSSLDTCIFLASLAITNDTLKKSGIISTEKSRYVARFAIVAIAIISALSALMNRDIIAVLYGVFLIFVASFPPVAAFFLLKKVNERAVFWVSLATSFTVAFLIYKGHTGEGPSLILGATSVSVLLIWNSVVNLKNSKKNEATV